MSYIHPSSQCHISLDIETLGTKPGCKIIEIGMARMFTTDPGKFTIRIDSAQLGLVEDPDTVAWWDRQQMTRPDQYHVCSSIEIALKEMSEWIIGEAEDSSLVNPSKEEAIKSVYIWAKSPSFDCAILKYAFELYGIPVPWTFRGEQDVRTALLLANVNEKDIPFIGTRHVALDDAIHQAEIVELCYRRLDLL